MTLTQTDLQTLGQQLTELLPYLQQTYGVTRLGIFGSYQRGEQTPNSDLDILVEFHPDRRFGLLTFCQLENELSDRLGVKVDLVMRDGLKPHVGDRILAEVNYLGLLGSR
ncbi:nucleotidyltransferase [Geitlerinema sp. P-1104]|uniref:nucleotidyltransferase family protein n=2 Tax=Cyanophyceae TaxID=3028117 RepID=UPI001477681C|nr:nucleotidyltransferase family protein [Geitlerinema sp. P-1104]NMG59184.1 nucleotidyltransferase [Geitlerinema sp. P-1104]